MPKSPFTPLSPEHVAEMTADARAAYEQRYGPVYVEAAEVAAQISEGLGPPGAYWSTTVVVDGEPAQIETHIAPAQLHDIWPYLTPTERLELLQGHVTAAHERIMGSTEIQPPTVVDSYQTSGGDACYIRPDQEIRVHPQLLRQETPGDVIPCVDHELAHDVVYKACDATLSDAEGGAGDGIRVSPELAHAINASEQAYVSGGFVPLERAIETGYAQAAEQSIHYREQPAETIPWRVHPPHVAAFAANEQGVVDNEEPILGAALAAGITLAAAQSPFQLYTEKDASDPMEPSPASSTVQAVEDDRRNTAVVGGSLELVHIIA